MADKYLGRTIEVRMSFKEKGDFQSLYEAQGWLSAHGFTYGSTDGSHHVAICKDEYTLPQKWRNLSKQQQENVIGVLKSYDFRFGEVHIIFFKDKDLINQ